MVPDDNKSIREWDAEFRFIKETLDWAAKYGLEVEVIHHAMQSLQRNPNQTIQDVLNAAAWSWDL